MGQLVLVRDSHRELVVDEQAIELYCSNKRVNKDVVVQSLRPS